MSKKIVLKYKYRIHLDTGEISMNPIDAKSPMFEYANTLSEISTILNRLGEHHIQKGRKFIKMAEMKRIVLPDAKKRK